MGAADPMAAADDSAGMPDDESGEPTPFSVTITSNGDGTYSVGEESAKSIEEAVQIAGEMLQQEAGEDAGDEPDDSSSMTGDGQGAMGGAGNAPMAEGAAKKYWRQMAAAKDKG